MWRFYVNSSSVFVPRNVSIFLGFTDKIDFALIRFHQKGKSKNPLPQWNNNDDDNNNNNNNNNNNSRVVVVVVVAVVISPKY